MRSSCFALFLLSGPAAAWEFTPYPICTLFHQGAEMAVAVTYDARVPEYKIRLSREEGWPDGPVFALRFEGARNLTISTDRHMIDPQDTRNLVVRDRGFGNVLNGLQFNTRAVASIGGLDIPVSLVGAAPTVRAFRACPLDNLVEAHLR
ncbi:excinuclease ABC subunit B [Marivita sp. S0852]|uniref:excinuclease ABC subunit B n=1 Tax=Marivita sp. S0852 TaxID=3373893 RepID=UPI003981B6DE